jgi:dethiobiotin synthetase
VKLLFVTATNTNIGKTFASLKLIENIAKHKLKVGVCKPIETGVEGEPLDAKRLLKGVKIHNNNFKSLTPKDITAYTFSLPSAPFCADERGEIELSRIFEKVTELKKLCDILIIEGAGGLMVPITKNYMMIDLAQELKAQVLLVTPSKLGCINDTILSIEALQNRNIAFDWCVNLYQDRESFETVTKPFYDEVFSDWWYLEEGLERFLKINLFINI